MSRQTAEQEEEHYPVPEDVEIETRIAQQEMAAEELIASVEKLGKISRLTCPDCHGALWEMRDDEVLRFRCHAGHAYSAESLNDGQSRMLETALWSAVRALEEQVILAQRVGERARKANHTRAVRVFEERVREAEVHSAAIRRVLLHGKKGDIAEDPIEGRDE